MITPFERLNRLRFLFGSMASGTNNIYRDLDLLLAADADFPLKKQIIKQIENYASDLVMPLALSIYSEIDLKKRRS